MNRNNCHAQTCLRSMMIWLQEPINQRSSALGTDATSLQFFILETLTRQHIPIEPCRFRMDFKAQSKPLIRAECDPYDLYKSDMMRLPVSASRATHNFRPYQTVSIPTIFVRTSISSFVKSAIGLPQLSSKPTPIFQPHRLHSNLIATT